MLKKYRAFLIPAIGVVAILGGFLFFSLNESLVYFRTPNELLEEGPVEGERLRLGGQVVEGTVVSGENEVTFEVTDGIQAVRVVHEGAPQQLFREGIGVVVEGRWEGGVFHSDTMIIRHDEEYRTRDGEEYTPPGGEEASSG